MGGRVIPWSDDVGVADWIVEGLSDDLRSVAWLVPRDFPAVARLLHPIIEWRGGQRMTIRWADIAAEGGQALTSEAQFPALVSSSGTRWTRHDQEFIGTLPVEEACVLAEILRSFTKTPARCWFGLSREFGWKGSRYPVGHGVFSSEDSVLSPDADPSPESGDPETPGTQYARRVVEAPHRAFMLYPGPIDDVDFIARNFKWSQIPNLWWPEDRSWCVRTDIDLDSTYIAGSDQLIATLIDEPRLEVLRAHPDDSIVRGV